MRVGARELVRRVLDDHVSWDVEPRPVAEAGSDYALELVAARERSGCDEAVLTGEGWLRGRRVGFVVSEFSFLAGSIGVATADRIVAAVERATDEGLPLVAAPSSGGTRMQEGTVAFAQMARITAAVTRHRAAGLPYLVYLRHPTTGGVFASWGSLGHVTAAEPGALIGFLGPRVYEGMYGKAFPGGVQVAENLFAKGLIDAVVGIDELPEVAADALEVLASRPLSTESPSTSKSPARRLTMVLGSPPGRAGAALGQAKTSQTTDAGVGLGWGEAPQSTEAGAAHGQGETSQTNEAGTALGQVKTPQTAEAEAGLGQAKTPQSGDAGAGFGRGETSQSGDAGVALARGAAPQSGDAGAGLGQGKTPRTPEAGAALSQEKAPQTAGAGSAWESILISRKEERPGVRELLRYGADRITPMSGTGQGEADPGLLLALARFAETPCVVVGQDRRSQRQGHLLGPAGLRVARRGMGLAAELGLPLVTVVDTPGAELSVEAEEGGLAGEIARCLADLINLPTPTVCLLMGEGTGGAALALLPADRVLAARHAWLAPLPPEGASVIVHRTPERAPEVAEAQGVRSTDLIRNGLVDEIVDERPDAADEPEAFCRRAAEAIGRALTRGLEP